MRLIDANKMQIPMKMVQNVCGCYMMRVEDVQRLVTQQPTVYDVDKVVEELLQCTVCNGHKDNENNCGGCAGCVECKLEDAYYKAIEIVKRGGVNEMEK